MSNLSILSEKVGVKFKNESFIEHAFVHRSYLNESKKFSESNERLEFLGDSILSFLTSTFLYNKFPKEPEGQLTNLRSSIVKTSTLADIAAVLSLGDYLLLSKGEEEGGGRKNQSILADTFEAFLGTVYLDSGIDAAEKILVTHLFPLLDRVLKEKLYKDSKSSFQESVQEDARVSPQYRVLKETGPDHAKEFTVGVYVDNKLWGEGMGKSKQDAEQKAATQALEKWEKRKYNT